MHLKETPTRKSLLAYITQAAVASSDTDVQPLLDIFNPGPSDDRETMGAKYKEVLGYNPITHFDFSDVLSAIDKIRLEDADPDLASDLAKMATPLAKRAIELFDERRAGYLNECLAEAGMELLPRTKAEEFSTMLIGRVFEDIEEVDEGVADEIDDPTLSLDGGIDIDDPAEDFGLEDEDD